jgi:hypothetical protein
VVPQEGFDFRADRRVRVAQDLRRRPCAIEHTNLVDPAVKELALRLIAADEKRMI